MKCEVCSKENVAGARFCAHCGALLPAEVKDLDPMIGQLVGGRFRVTGVLGEGGMGVVYVGEQQMGTAVRKVAIKTLHAHLSKDQSVLQRFHREVGTVAQLEHPNTIKVYDFGSTADGTLYIAMEFVSGRPLSNVIQTSGTLEPERVIRIMRQICGALDEAHGQGIIHRDLKPDNVILTTRAGEADFVKVLDFGIAARSESADAQKEQKLTQQGMVLGTPPYMSPEQFTGKALDARSDVYSLGIMVYEMLVGRLPFEADTPWQWATQHMTAQPMPLETAAPSKHFDPALRAAVSKALAKDREQRQASAREFFADLSQGGRVTVEAAAPVAGPPVVGTAAMDVVPDFQKSAPAGSAPVATVHGTPAGIATPVRSPPARPEKGGGKGLVMGLVAIGGVLALAIAIVGLRSMKKPDETLPPIAEQPKTSGPTSGALGNNGVTTIAPVDSPAPAPTPAASENPDKGGTPQKPTHSTTPASNPGTPGSATPPKQPAAGGGSCDACASLAGSSVAAAAAALQSCTDEAKKKACLGAIRRQAPQAAQAAAMNGNCGQAQAIIAAAERAGVPGAPLRAAIRNTSCAK